MNFEVNNSLFKILNNLFLSSFAIFDRHTILFHILGKGHDKILYMHDSQCIAQFDASSFYYAAQIGNKLLNFFASAFFLEGYSWFLSLLLQ